MPAERTPPVKAAAAPVADEPTAPLATAAGTARGTLVQMPPPPTSDPGEEFYSEDQLSELPQPIAPARLPPSASVPQAQGARVELLIDDLGRVLRVRRLEGLPAAADWTLVQRALMDVAFQPGRRQSMAVKSALRLQLTLDGDRLRW